MRTLTLGQALAVLLLLLAPLLAHAAGLGRLSVQSGLGQPLIAEIDLVAVRSDDLNVRLASPDAYRQANLQYNSGVTGLKLSIEKRSNGQSYIKVTGNRPINEPFVDLLVELTWSGGKLSREYTALLDPPGYGQQAAVAAVPVTPAAPESRPITAPATPAATPMAPSSMAPASPTAQEYGPIARGETLGKIAASLKPEGVSLEQMLVGLYRNNPDAFIRNNLNLVKSGKILRVPDAQELAAVSQGEARKEYQTHVADWRAYSGRVADAAGQAPEGGSTARGRITARVEDAGADADKDVVKLSKGEPGKGDKPLTGAARTRALQEELVARTKELEEANERIAQLEKTIKATQQLAELKSPGMAAAQQQAEAAKAAKPEPAAPVTATPTETAAAPKTEAPAADAMKAESMTPPPAPAETPVAEAQTAPKPKPKPVAPPPPPPEPDMMDMVMDNLPLIGGGVGALLLGGLGIAALRRRRAHAQDADETLVQVAPTFGADASGETEAALMDDEAKPAATEEVDPVAEAEVYIAYGRDGQAEEILKEAMSRDPAREDVQVKLAQVYSARQDAAAFAPVAESLHALTGGAGENWTKVAALGYALDSANPLYEAGKDIAPVRSVENPPTSTDLDFDLGGDGVGAPDIALDADEPAGQETEIGGMRNMAAAADAGAEPEPAMPDFNLDAPAEGAETDIKLEAAAPGEDSSIDFNIELPEADETTTLKPATAPAAPTDSGLDFKIDVGDLNIDLDDTSTAAPPPGAEKDSHWYDVQQKFDLAKAYQEMGDNEGAREILQEVITEGDAGQKDQAKKLCSAHSASRVVGALS